MRQWWVGADCPYVKSKTVSGWCCQCHSKWSGRFCINFVAQNAVYEDYSCYVTYLFPESEYLWTAFLLSCAIISSHLIYPKNILARRALSWPWCDFGSPCLRSSDFDAIARKSKCHHSFKIKSCLTYGLTCWIFWGCTNEKGKNSKKLRNEYVTYLVHAWIHYTCPRIHHKKILRFCCFMWVFISHSLIARVQCFFLSACLVIWTTIGLKFSRFRCEGFC